MEHKNRSEIGHQFVRNRIASGNIEEYNIIIDYSENETSNKLCTHITNTEQITNTVKSNFKKVVRNIIEM